ncbi:MAG: cysteine synthase A [Bacteroidales bacterium]|nr:cysteine synthase A [Bacteroidales bacterium]MBD5293317.1 cysteine synthase A [Bacteroides sp.]
MKAENSLQLIGNTPLLELSKLAAALGGVKAKVLAKLEMNNPGKSVKDRAAMAMILDAEESGRLHPGDTIVEPTSGNTGIGLAWIGRDRGYRVILTMPDTMSLERRQLLQAYGAELVLTPGSEGMAGAVKRAEEICASTPGAIILGQFDNPANPKIHEQTTAPEILRDTDGRIDIFIAGVGTGGTVTGTGRGLKAVKPSIEVIAVEPEASPVLSGGKPGPHKIQGIGANFIPGNFDPQAVDRIMQVSDQEAIRFTRLLAQTEGILAGISSGAALAAAFREAQLPENANKTIVALLPDSGERYLSTGIFA